MYWKTIALLLCAFGLLKEFKPTEPYLYRYQHTFLNISADVLNSEIYPYWTYSYLLLSIPVMLITDLLLYKPVLILESVAYISVWLTLIFGRSVFSQKLGQILYGLCTSTEIAYYAYAYVKFDKNKYSRLTAWSRAALQFGKCFAYILAQLILLFEWGDYQTLNWISLGSLLMTLPVALALPWVRHRELTASGRQKEKITKFFADTKNPREDLDETEEATRIANTNNTTPPITFPSYGEFAVSKITGFWGSVKQIFADKQLFRWSLWWALASCGDLLVGNYIQLLWDETQANMRNSKIYNGFVEGTIPLLAGLTLMLFERLQLNWSRWGEFALAGIASSECLVLLGMSQTGNLYLMYIGYGTIRILYQISITIAQFNIALRIDVSNVGFIFGLNTFLALAMQSTLTFLFVDVHGPLHLSIRPQFIVYGFYHCLIAAIFFGAQLLGLLLTK